jgi:hypothetical protein
MWRQEAIMEEENSEAIDQMSGFPGLKTYVQASIATVNDLERLQELIPDLSVLPQEEIDQFCKDQLQEEIDL